MANFNGVSFVSDDAMNRWGFENSLVNLGLSLPQLPWESGVYRQIFNPGALPEELDLPGAHFPVASFAEMEPDDGDPPELLPPPGDQVPVYARCVKALTDRDYDASQTLKWNKALAVWSGILEGSKLESAVGEHVHYCLCNNDRTGAIAAIRDACGIRSPRTVLQRGRDLKKYIQWNMMFDQQWWPLDEKAVAEYLNWAETHVKSKLIGKNLIHSLKFFRYVMGGNFNIDRILSPVVTGRSARISATRDPREQARPLTLEELTKLEQLQEGSKNLIDKFMLGCILFAIYGRCRWADLECVASLDFDIVDIPDGGSFGFVEMRTRVHKTGGTEERKAMFMPYVAPINGVRETPWATIWMETMKKLEIDWSVKNFGAICRAPRSDGGFTKRPITTDEISSMLNRFLGYSPKSPCYTTSHSMKTTLLTWSARYGLGEKTRTLLGHHSLREDSLACYSRDLMANPMKELAGMLLNIREGKFRPDLTRSGWMSTEQVSLNVATGGGGAATPPFAEPSVPQTKEQSTVVEVEKVGDSVSHEWEQVDELGLDLDDHLEQNSVAPNTVLSAPASEVEGNDGLAAFHAAMRSEPEVTSARFEVTDHTTLSELQSALDNMYEPTYGNDEPEEILESASSVEDCTDDSSSDSDEETFHASQTDKGSYPEIIVIPGDLLQNKKSRMLHRVSPGTEMSLCGVQGANFTRLKDGSKFWWPRCNKCFKGELADTEEKVIAILDRAKRRRMSQ